MDESGLETHGPKHHSFRLKPAILILIGLVVGGAIYFGVMAWYFTRIDPSGGPRGVEGDARKSSSDDAGNGSFALEKDVLEIVPLSELRVKIVSGIAESVETPKDSGLTATLEGNSVKSSAAKDAKAGPHQIRIPGYQGKASDSQRERKAIANLRPIAFAL